MLAFEYPWAFAVLPLPLLAWWLLPPYREATRAVRIPFFEQTAHAAGLEPTRGAVMPRRHWLVVALAVVVWCLVVAALARPQWVQPPLERVEPARDLLLAIDLSQSMEARDFVDPQGNRIDRLAAVKLVVDDFIARRKTDRIGLIVFGQAAFPQAPLTLDHRSVRLLLDQTRIGMAGPQTAIGDAIGIAIKMTEQSKTQEKMLVLLTDGNDTASRLPPQKAAEIAKDHHITIHTIGIGDPTATGENKVDLQALERIAQATGGRSFRGEDRQGLEQIYATIDKLAPDKAKRTLYRPKTELYWIPLGAGALLLAAYHLLMLLWTHRKHAISVACVALFCVPTHADAQLPVPPTTLPPAAPATPAPPATPATPSTAATPTATHRPKVCLVLSGGGARGAAHIGVLKVLDELRVPIDCVAGTSMGSIVGAAFASGMTTDEMEKVIAGLSTELLFKEKPPRQERSIRRKKDDFTNLFTPDIGVRDGTLLLPKGFVSGVQLETVLRRLAKAEGFRKFDELPVQYRAVATDLVTGQPVVFDEGELAAVMRASMSVPAAIDPAEVGGKILVDGGLTNNLPVDVARAMGADIVIAVNLGTPLMKREELSSILGVTGQMINILTEQNVRASLASLKPTDVLILPELGDYSAADFDHLPTTVPIGEAAARKVADRLRELSVPPQQYAAIRHRQLAVAPPDLRPVDEIRFENLQRVNPRGLEAIMETRVGEPIDQGTLDRDMRRLFGTDDFERVNYRFLEEPGKRVLAVDALEKSWGPDYLRFGLGLTSDFRGDAYYNFLTSYRKTWINSLGAEWRTDVQLGRTNRLFTEFYQPLEARQYFFVAPYAELERRPFDLFQGNNRIARYDVKYARAGFDIGSQFTRYGELRVGVLRGTLDAKIDTGPAFLDPGTGKVDQGAIRTRLFFDQLDNVNFPRFGYGGTLDVFSSRGTLGADASYNRWDTSGTLAYSFGEHTFNAGFRLGGAIGSAPLPIYDKFQWGGFLQQSGYRTGALFGESIAFGRLVYLHRLAHFPFVDGVYAGTSLEVGKVGQPVVPGSPTGTLTSIAVFLGLDSFVGPLYFGYGHADDGSSSFYMFLGRP